ncbi:MAG TPA: substrate-binding domain-containing protein [Phycisphaerae bacterium]|nr:substrate-binding domain-containing protein [Phycisphaerae bacterium]
MKLPAYIGVLLLGLAGCRSQPATSGPGPATQPAEGRATAPTTKKPLRIALIPKGTTHEFWKTVHCGAIQAERELGGVEVIFQGPEKEDDREQQISLVQNFISSRIDAIVLAPLDDRALLSAVQQATAKKIPVVIIDSGLAGEAGKDFVSFAATDNYQGGQLAGKRMAEVLGAKGRVLILRYLEGSASTTERERGFIEALAQFPGMHLIDPHRYAGATRATAQEASENLLTAETDLQGVFCPNESSTFGMLLALRGRGLAGKIHFVGFDASPGLVEALAQGELDGLIVQDPMRMGNLGIKTALNALQGKPVELRQDTGVVLVTKQTMNLPENQDLLKPDLANCLGE